GFREPAFGIRSTHVSASYPSRSESSSHRTWDLRSTIQHDGQRQRHAVRHLEGVGIIERDSMAGKLERDQGYEDVSDVTQRLPESSFVDDQDHRHYSGYEYGQE